MTAATDVSCALPPCMQETRGKPACGEDGRREPGTATDRTLHRIALACGAAAAGIGMLTLVGWRFDIAALTRIFPDWAAMGPVTAFGILLGGGTLMLQQVLPSTRCARAASRGPALVLSVLALLVLIHNIPESNPVFSGFASPEQIAATGIHYTAHVTALSLLLLGAALSLLTLPIPGALALAQILALVVLAPGTLAVLGYLYGIETLYALNLFNGFALHTALAFVMLAVGVLAAPGRRGWLALAASQGPGGVMLRRLWLPGLFIVVLLGWLRLQGEKAGLFGTEFGVALMVSMAVGVLTVLTWRTARWLEDTEVQRRLVETEKDRLNAELEQRVEQRTAELAASNRELESFAYSVSHDLRAPLRAIDGFGRLVVEKHGAQQMGALIDDLLAFSRTGRQALALQRVDTPRLVNESLQVVRSEHDGSRAIIEIGELPECEGDPVLLRQVWTNLLANALKFSGKRETPSIEIGSYAEKGERVFFVRDNGVGFDMRYADKLFGVFQRLHRVSEFPGTGVGLALAQRIVQRHGGRIWAEAQPDRGATFHFTLQGRPS
jgi:signal transduction histidine kinase